MFIKNNLHLHNFTSNKSLYNIISQFRKNATIKLNTFDSYVSTPGGNKSNHTAFMHTFYGVFEIDKKRYLYKLFVEEFLNDGNIQRRGYEIKDIKIVPTSSSESDADASFSQPVNIDTIKSVADLSRRKTDLVEKRGCLKTPPFFCERPRKRCVNIGKKRDLMRKSIYLLTNLN